jgi:hypothetical protein
MSAGRQAYHVFSFVFFVGYARPGFAFDHANDFRTLRAAQNVER